ncbi:MAG: hypothetical protein HYW48_00100 [Deltaproteobacteria bacterium]|nr:hypothetical protein [Deltaproteobacteria bacterium]
MVRVQVANGLRLLSVVLTPIFCIELRASTLSDLAQRMGESTTQEESRLIKEESAQFALSPQALADGHLQMGLNVLTSPQFKDQASNFDVDDFAFVLGASDLVLIAKGAFVFRNVQPDFFNASNILSSPQLREAMFDGSVIGNIDLAGNSLSLTTAIWRFNFTNRTHFSQYNYRSNEGFGFEAAQAGDLMDRFPLDDVPAFVTSTSAKGADIGTYGTWGGRTVNLYYDINGLDTLLISYKLMTLRWEWKLYPFWSQIITEAPDSYFKGTFKSLQKMRQAVLQVKQ